ncbi:hypothetical protein LCGC14_2280530, partial [marine sediment metagenome]
MPSDCPVGGADADMRRPMETEDYPGLTVLNARVTGSITLGGGRL